MQPFVRNERALSRRAWLGLTAAWVARPVSAATPDRFVALGRPARPVVRPDKVVLQGAAVAGSRVVVVGERGVVALSDDGARRWRQAKCVPVSVTLTAVRFADPMNGWAVGHGGVILATRDGGDTWSLQADGRTLAQAAVRAAASRTPDPRGAALAKQAEQLVQDGPDKPLLDLHVIDARRIVVAGAYGLFAETIDGGATWTAALDRLDNAKGLHLNEIAARGEHWLLVGEQGLLLRSIDGGSRFARLASPYAGTWFAAASPAEGEWIVAGLRGQAWRSVDGGERWSRLEGAPPASFASASALPDGGVLLANQAGQLLTSRGGSALAVVPGASLPPLSQALALPGGALLALGWAGAIRLEARPA
jgi:photosystem II stability/assembly factor-like uncharacterized protein